MNYIQQVPEDDEWEKHYKCFCPLCKHWFEGSEYLGTVFTEPKHLLLANLVTHYRHEHVRYDKNYGYVVHYKNYMDREEYQHDVNERAKRQYARKATVWFKEHGYTVDDVVALQGTTEDTIKVWQKKIGGDYTPIIKETIPEELFFDNGIKSCF